MRDVESNSSEFYFRKFTYAKLRERPKCRFDKRRILASDHWTHLVLVNIWNPILLTAPCRLSQPERRLAWLAMVWPR